MSNEISITGSLTAYKPSVMSSAMSRALSGLTFDMSGSVFAQDTILVATTATLIPVGQVVEPHWAFFYNHDDTNSVAIRNGSTGADVIQLLAGEPAWVPLLSTGTYYAIASGGSVYLEYLILSL